MDSDPDETDSSNDPGLESAPEDLIIELGPGASRDEYKDVSSFLVSMRKL
jgi:hypothetical protein